MSRQYYIHNETGKASFKKTMPFKLNKDLMVYAVTHHLTSLGKVPSLSYLTHIQFKEITTQYFEDYGYTQLQYLDKDKISDDRQFVETNLNKTALAFDYAFKGQKHELEVKRQYYVSADDLEAVVIIEKLASIADILNTRLKQVSLTQNEIMKMYCDHILFHGCYGMNRFDTDDALYGKESKEIDKINEYASKIVRKAFPKLYELSKAV